MELFGGLIMIIWMIGFFLAVVWFILPFVIFSIKGRIEESINRLELIERRLTGIEAKLEIDKSDAHS